MHSVIQPLECAVKKLDCANKGISIDGKQLKNFRFADDIVIIADDINEANEMLTELAKAAEEVGLQINKDKTKIMTWKIKELTRKPEYKQNIGVDEKRDIEMDTENKLMVWTNYIEQLFNDNRDTIDNEYFVEETGPEIT
ncbi:uncharacterized protein LOC126890342 [Diabrotica virgifera virgifera]|uniref:Reverse transcriptase domain-containing protein n=1 Tax=Diabrotica virgifera virgifera TaxID=50390 RepID=A0ABM5KYA0_DIAVI|nr:uncharacterized protein LOC126890342 [Diabrotica virgifera virgifera]